MPSSKRGIVRTAALVLGLLVPTLTLGVLCLAQEGKTNGKAETAGQKFKNIKVLKDLPADQLIPYMRAYNAALGVKCDACHVINADHSGFEKDDKELKKVARSMIVLVNDLNKKQKSVRGKATCFMCHHGHPEPQTHPAPEENH